VDDLVRSIKLAEEYGLLVQWFIEQMRTGNMLDLCNIRWNTLNTPSENIKDVIRELRDITHQQTKTIKSRDRQVTEMKKEIKSLREYINSHPMDPIDRDA